MLPDISEGLRVLADPQRLEQVFVNLLLNALDALADLPARRIEILVQETGCHVIATVRDGGTGIPESTLPHLFEPFYTTKSSGHGLGLGLAISRMIVEELGGEIAATNRPEGGADFCITLEKA